MNNCYSWLNHSFTAVKIVYKSLIQWSESNKKLLTRKLLTLKKSKSLDRVVHSAHNEAFNEIDCLDCANCCKTTGPLLTPPDVQRISSKLKKTEKSFVEEYLRRDEDDDLVFKSMPCPFLQDDNACSIYSFRPRACRAFPHTDQAGQASILNLTRKNAKIFFRKRIKSNT